MLELVSLWAKRAALSRSESNSVISAEATDTGRFSIMDGYPLTKRHVFGRFAHANTEKGRRDRVAVSALELTNGWPAPTLRLSIDRLLAEPGIKDGWRFEMWSFPAAFFVRETVTEQRKEAAE